MKNNVTGDDTEYFKRYVNSRNDDIAFIKKNTTISIFLLVPILGVILSFYWMDSTALRIAFMAIMVGGVAITIASGKWFPGNKQYLFLAWIGVAGIGIMCFSIGIVLVYGILNTLILAFIAIHVVIAFLTMNNIRKRISNRQIPKGNVKDSRKKKKYYELGSGIVVILACVIIIQITEGVDNDQKNIVLAVCFMSASTVIWARTRRLFQLYYAVKYDIDVVNTWDTQKGSFGSIEKFQCPLLGKTIEESLCEKINYENEKMLKQDKLKTVKKALNMTSDEIKQICKSCDHFPFSDK